MAGDDYDAGRATVAVVQRDPEPLAICRVTSFLGDSVEFADQVTGGCQHERVQAVRLVVIPGVEDLLGQGREVADMDAVVVEVEPECLWSPFSQGERRGGFGWVGEAQDLGEPGGPVCGLDVAQHAASADGGQLPVVSDEADAATAADHVVDGAVEANGVGHAGFIDDDQAPSRPASVQGGVDSGDFADGALARTPRASTR